jgi:hypothetical protein
MVITVISDFYIDNSNNLIALISCQVDDSDNKTLPALTGYLTWRKWNLLASSVRG